MSRRRTVRLTALLRELSRGACHSAPVVRLLMITAETAMVIPVEPLVCQQSCGKAQPSCAKPLNADSQMQWLFSCQWLYHECTLQALPRTALTRVQPWNMPSSGLSNMAAAWLSSSSSRGPVWRCPPGCSARATSPSGSSSVSSGAWSVPLPSKPSLLSAVMHGKAGGCPQHLLLPSRVVISRYLGWGVLGP